MRAALRIRDAVKSVVAMTSHSCNSCCNSVYRHYKQTQIESSSGDGLAWRAAANRWTDNERRFSTARSACFTDAMHVDTVCISRTVINDQAPEASSCFQRNFYAWLQVCAVSGGYWYRFSYFFISLKRCMPCRLKIAFWLPSYEFLPCKLHNWIANYIYINKLKKEYLVSVITTFSHFCHRTT